MNELPAEVLKGLNSFDSDIRRQSLAKAADLVKSGKITPPPTTGWVNVHCHTIFSYSSEDYSPSRLVWEALMRGLSVVGSTDFDVLDAMDEMYIAGDALGVRTTVALETRTFVDAYADKEINSPGEPGVMYNMGAGFIRVPDGPLFASLKQQSRERNEVMVGKVNAVLAPVAIDYAKDVLPLTPSGNATERHICAAYENKANQVFTDTWERVSFWAKALGVKQEEAEKLVANPGSLRNTIRAKLMKKGGVGYSQPDSGAFPPVRDFFKMVASARAMPCLAWLDGTTPGEADPDKLLEDAIAWGARVVNVVPDRNWNIADPAAKAKKVAALEAFMQAAKKRHLPVMAGTEMNGPGQKFVDSFDAPELAPYVADFQDGAYWLYGHTVLERLAGKGVMSPWAKERFAADWAKANAFYIEVGKRAVPGQEIWNHKSNASAAATPEAVLAIWK